jgi:hypothetical protein
MKQALRRSVVALVLTLASLPAGNLFLASTSVEAASGQPAAQPPDQQDGFVPISELPPQDRLPAAPLLIGAYVFVLAVLFAYVLSVARRLSALQKDVARLEGDLAKRGRG